MLHKMRKISRSNYEEFFLDYLEGNLSLQEMNDLDCFLIQHPDLKAELDEMELTILEEEKVVFDSESLKEIPFRNNFDEFCIARIEGILLPSEKKAFDTFLKNNQKFEIEHENYLKTILNPDFSVVFPDKNILKQNRRKIVPFWQLSRIAIAASVILMFSIWNVIFQEEEKNNEKGNLLPQQIEVETANLMDLENSRKTEISTEISNENIHVKPTDSKENKPIKVEVGSEPTSISYVKASETERIGIPVLIADIEVKPLANTALLKENLEYSKERITEDISQNNGLAQLGTSWKSSLPEKKNSILFAIAKYGVDKLGEIAGKKVQLEKEYDSNTEKTKLNFNTAGLGFSTTVK